MATKKENNPPHSVRLGGKNHAELQRIAVIVGLPVNETHRRAVEMGLPLVELQYAKPAQLRAS